MSVFDNMAFGLKMRKFPRAEIEKRVKEAADILGIQDLLERKPRQLSGGQRQRVAVGRAIVRHPQVFLFDEPLSSLDAKLRVQMRVELKRLHDRLQSTAIYVTDHQVEAMTLGEQVVVMKDGSIQQIGEPPEVYSRPRNKFVAGFIGSPAMNFIDASITEAPGELCAEAAGIRAPVPAERSRQLLVARVDSSCRARHHQKIRLALAPERIHFFDPQTEEASSNLFCSDSSFWRLQLLDMGEQQGI